MARFSQRICRRGWGSERCKNRPGHHFQRQGCRSHRRHIPERIDARGTRQDSRRTRFGTSSIGHHRATGVAGIHRWPHENGHTASTRRALDRLHAVHPSRRRTGFPPFFIPARHHFHAAATSLLDCAHQRTGARGAATRLTLVAALQRPDHEHRPPLLPQHRDQDRDLCRQDIAPTLHRARGSRNPRDVPQRLLIIAALGGANRSAAPYPGAEKRACFPSWLCHRI